MSLSPALTDLNYDRFQSFDAQSPRACIAAFEGQAYKGLDAGSLNTAQLDYCQARLRILCGLYGVLRPYDEIRPYRLEMSTRMSCAGAKDLYAFWREKITKTIINEVAPGSFILNVASQEYAKAVDLKGLPVPVITAAFPGPAVHAKQARGEMVRFCAEQGVVKPEALRAFRGTNGNWAFVPESSDESTYTFRRSAAGASASASGDASKPATTTAAAPKAAAGKRKR